MEGVFYIITGLIFDIAGAIFIIRPLLDRVRKLPEEEEIEEEIEEEEEENKIEKLFLTMNPFSQYRRNYQLAWTGLILLCLGFVLQIIGNYIQSLEFMK